HFPEGYPVAKITRMANEEQSPFAEIKAEPLATLDRLRYVLLLWEDAKAMGPLPVMSEASSAATATSAAISTSAATATVPSPSLEQKTPEKGQKIGAEVTSAAKNKSVFMTSGKEKHQEQR
ncbi:MAG: hypothetical protein QMB71_01615, partial [Tolumonas sp.]